MRVIGIGSGKGGVGRSTLTANLGVALAEMGESTLIIDACITSPNQALFFNLEKVPRTINDVLMGGISLEEAVYNGPKGVHVIPASVSIDKMRRAKPSRLSQVILNRVEGYEYVLLDTPNGLRGETIAALKSCKELLLVTVPEITAVTDTMKTKAAAGFLDLDLTGLVLNQVKGEEYELDTDEITRIMDLPIFSSIPYDKEVLRSLKEGKVLLEWSPDSPASREIKKLANKLMKEES